MRIDLHLHSTASDGSLSPSALMRAARAGGLDVVALTDHDTCEGVAEAMRSLPDQLHLIPAIELSSHYQGSEHHILGYFIDPQHSRLREYSTSAIDQRRDRLARMIDKLKQQGLRITLDQVEAAAEPGTRALGRPHLARAMVRYGFVPSVAEAFDRFIGDHGPAYLPTQMLTPVEAICLIHDAGGVAVWAHPRMSAVELLLDAFIVWGLDGIECFRPGLASSETLQLEMLAKRGELLITGGSDWHGIWQGPLGAFYLSHDEVDRLLEVGGI